MTSIEILAPVGNIEMLYAAARSGADAVYLGVTDFNARRNAQNFTIDTLPQAVEYCHIRGIKVYLTLNILINDNEFEDAVKLCFDAYNCGVDAVIIADLGLASYINKVLPNLPLHASTQMTVFSPQALKPLKDIGITRAVAARELSRQEIIALTNKAKELNMEIEVFVHGALCMSVSGQCLMSAFLGGRSGNRGLCAGPCRLPFSANKEKERYDLSLKDLSLMEYLGELKDIGVASFKIEGRMKRPEYVAAATIAARYSLNDGKLPDNIKQLLSGVFSRSGFTDGYYTQNTGINMFGSRSKDDVLSAASVMPKLHELYRKEYSHIPIDAVLNLDKNGCSLSISDGINTVSVTGENAEEAQSSPTTNESAFKALNKFGNTPFVLNNLTLNTKPNLIIRASALNNMRRSAVDALCSKRSQQKKQTDYKSIDLLPKAKLRKASGFILRLETIDLLPNDINGIKAVLIPAENINKEFSLLPIIAELPRIEKDQTVLLLLKKLKQLNIKYVSCGNLSHISLAKELGFDIVFGFGMNVFSSYSANYAEGLNAKGVLLSPEMTALQINSLKSNIPTAIIAYGKIPLMIFKNCPIKNIKNCESCQKSSKLTDRKGIEFEVKCRLGFSELFNSKPIVLSDKLNEFNCDYFCLYFNGETKKEIAEIFNAYKNGSTLNKDFTRGLYFKGVI